MHFIARLLHGDAAVTKELAKDEQEVHMGLAKFFASYQIKQNVLEFLQRGEPMSVHIYKLQYALQDEMKVIEESEHKEKEMIQDLKYLSKEHYLHHFEELCSELNKATTRDKFVRHVLSELHDTLLSEARKVRRIIHGDNDLALSQTLIDLLTIERHLVEKLSAMEDFRKLFVDLHIGTSRRTAVKDIQQKFKDHIKQLMHGVQMNDSGQMESVDGHYVSELTARIFNKLESAVIGAVQNGNIDRHPNVDVEFVNSPLFERFLGVELRLDKSVGKFVPSPRTVEAFIVAFRDMYNKQAQPQKVVA